MKDSLNSMESKPEIEPGRKLRILFVGLTWPPITFLGRLVKGLADAGEEVTVACSKKPGKEWLEHANIRWLHTPHWKGFILIRLFSTGWRFLKAMLFAREDLRIFTRYAHSFRRWRRRAYALNLLLPYAGKRWDVIYFPWNSFAISHLPLFELGSPVVISCRGSQVNVVPQNPSRSKLRDGLALTFEKAGAVHCVSEAILNEAARHGLDRGKARIIRPAVDPSFFCPSKQESENEIFRVVTVGSLIWRKGYESALLAVKRLSEMGVPVLFEVIGKGPELGRILFTIQDLGLNGKVELLGNLRADEIRDRLQKADAFLLSSLSEGISNAVLEAMACGKPVVTTDCGGMQEAVEDGVEGFVVPILEAEPIARALHTLWQQPELRRQMGRSARERIVRQFSLKQQIDQFRNLYHEVADRIPLIPSNELAEKVVLQGENHE